MKLRQTLLILFGLWWNTMEFVGAAPCLRLTGIVEDQTSHRPLDAQLYVKTPNGRVSVGNSAAGSGLFSVDVPCPASVLFIERAGYRPQQLRLNSLPAGSEKEVIALIIPLTAVDPLDIDKPYLQTEQTHYEQTPVSNAGRWQHHNEFIVRDALSGDPVTALVCFFFTRSSRKTCLNTGAGGKVRLSFPEKDIVAVEITADGYQSYQGNLIVEKPTVNRLHHTIRLTRELTLLSVQLDAPGNAELYPIDQGDPIRFRTVPEQRNRMLTCQASPRSYTVRVYDSNHTVRVRRTIQLKAGLNAIKLTGLPDLNNLPAPNFTSDSLPTLYFDQGSYALRPETKQILHKAVAYLTNNPTQRIQLVGHADPEGDLRLNYSLSENRVKVVSTFLYTQGVSERQIESISYGSRYPVAPSDTENNKAKNRRVQMRFIR